MVSGDWLVIEDSKRRMGIHIERKGQFLPGPAGLAGIYGIGAGVLWAHAGLSEGRDVWPLLSDKAFGFFRTGQHRGRIWTREYSNVHPAVADRSRLAEGAGNALAIGRAGRRNRNRNYGKSAGELRIRRQDAQVAHSLTPKESGRELMSTVAAAPHHSPLTTHHSLFGWDAEWPNNSCAISPSTSGRSIRRRTACCASCSNSTARWSSASTRTSACFIAAPRS